MTSQGLAWLPLGSRLVDHLRSLLIGRQAEWGEVIAEPYEGLSTFAERMKGEVPSHRDLPIVALAESPPAAVAVRSLRDTEILGVLEWGAAARDAQQAAAALRETERRLSDVLVRCGLDPQSGDGGPGQILWACLTPEGPTVFLRCGGCGYLAEQETASFVLPASPPSPPEALREVHTPGASTIKVLCDQLGINPAGTLKALFLTTSEGETLLALLRGDLAASLVKLRQRIDTKGLRPATPEDIGRLGVVAGYAGPVGLNVRSERHGRGTWVVADRSVVDAGNLVSGGNRDGFHLTGVNYPRDFGVTEVLDFARAPRGALCSRCGTALVEKKGLALGRRQILEHGLAFVSEHGVQQPGAVISLQLSLGAVTTGVMAAALQERGMRFPSVCAPFSVHAIVLPGGPSLATALEELGMRGIDILRDDRDLSAGVKFAEADWIGSPIRIVSGRKSAEAGGIEVRSGGAEPLVVPLASLVQAVLAGLGEVM
jgi:prolyl-tRNA synthetase